MILAEFAKVQNYVGTGRVEHFVDMHKVYGNQGIDLAQV